MAAPLPWPAHRWGGLEMAEGIVDWPSMSLWLHDEQRRRAFFMAGCRVGTRSMARLVKELEQLDLPAETPARRPDPPFLVIDEVGPPHSLAPGPTPRFAQLYCLCRQRSR